MKRFYSSIMLLCMGLAVMQGLAQTVTGTIRGTITDSTGAILAGATVTATNTATGVATVEKTNGAGEYAIRFLQIGQYTLTVEEQGFESAHYGPFALEIDQTAKVDIPLRVGSTTATVEVSGHMDPILNSDSATLGETFTENTLNSIPLNGRDFSEISVFTPGAVAPGFNAFGGQDSLERAQDNNNEVSVNGNRQESNNYLLDDQEINENIMNMTAYSPSPDSLAQIRVIASNANAEFGNVNGGTVLAVMKSGTNHLHGSVFGFLKNQNLDANSWSNDNNATPLPKTAYTQSQYGGTLGGPIIKDKLYFFVDYEGMRVHRAGMTNFSVAPAAFRTGDLSALLTPGLFTPNGVQLYDTQTIDPITNQPMAYSGNQIPITNPVALYLFNNPKAYPLPNNPTSDPLGIYNNFVGPSASFMDNDQGDAKVDWHPRTNDSLAFRYSQAFAQDGQTTDPIPVIFPMANNYPDHFADINWVHTFSSAIVNSFSANYGRIHYENGVTTDPSGIFGLTGNQLVGIPAKAQQTAGFSYQNFGSGGSGLPSGLGANPSPEIFIDNVFGYSENLTWQKGHHLLKFGGQFLRYQQNNFYAGNNGELGFFDYTGAFTSSPYSQSSTMYPFADFLVDRSLEVGIGSVQGRTGQRQWRDGFFAQDDWKLNEKLTLNLGFRWDYFQPIYEVNNKEANINEQTKQIEYAGVGGNSRALYNPTHTQFQPRVGFAYQLRPRLVVRGGYGISSYLEGTGAALRLTQNAPFHSDFQETGANPGVTGSVYSQGSYYQTSTGFPTTKVPVTNFYMWPKNIKPSTTQEYSLTTEYQLTGTATIQVGYVGMLGRHLTDPMFANQLTSPTATAPYASIVGQNGYVYETQTESASGYNALQAVFRQRLSQGLELTANYTYSHSLTNDIGFEGVSNNYSNQYFQQNSYDMRSEWGPSGMDTRHNLTVTGVYDLPFGSGKRYGANMNRVVNQAVGGWRLSGSEVFYSGFPVTVSSPAHYSALVNANIWAARPVQYLPLKVSHRTNNAYYGTAVQGTSCGPNQNNGTCIYAQQPNDAFGTVRPGSLRAPGFQNVDLAVSKSFSVYHEQRFDFRADMFNAFNIADYAPPDNWMTDGNFGQITGTVNNNRSAQLSLKYIF
jgi:outer membrane receptor protein involved in Fe transport